MKYIKGRNKIIEASEKAYNLIYKEQGFKPYKPKEDKEEVISENEFSEEGEINDTEGTD
ncbi:Uncharacterised protein [Clostridium baratii]|uniref:hypothetical protein n=1 Tax=Clostridium baratii TaxID=1561 RepID=UPI0006C2DB99|nr:hypothetical protein [Clostridium baratii]CUO91714.1 Uncharacterised protein [Clostridium baratii]